MVVPTVVSVSGPVDFKPSPELVEQFESLFAWRKESERSLANHILSEPVDPWLRAEFHRQQEVR